MTTIDKIRAEIERLKSKNPSEYNYQNAEGYIWGLDDILSFLDTLEEPVSEDLEEAAKEFANQDCVTFISRKKGFIAGAEWQKAKMMEKEDEQ